MAVGARGYPGCCGGPWGLGWRGAGAGGVRAWETPHPPLVGLRGGAVGGGCEGNCPKFQRDGMGGAVWGRAFQPPPPPPSPWDMEWDLGSFPSGTGGTGVRGRQGRAGGAVPGLGVQQGDKDGGGYL